VKAELGLSSLKVDWVPVAVDDQLAAVQQHQVDAMCGAVSVTLSRRKQVDFSLPIFPGGVSVAVRKDVPNQLRAILEGHAQTYNATWRAVALNILREQVFSAVAGTSAEQWIKQRGKELDVHSRLTPVPTYDAGLTAVADRKVNAFFGERAILLDAVQANPAYDDLTVIDRQFTYEPLALPLPRGDQDFRLLVDSTVSELYGSKQFTSTYHKYFGEPDTTAITFFRWNALPE